MYTRAAYVRAIVSVLEDSQHTNTSSIFLQYYMAVALLLARPQIYTSKTQNTKCKIQNINSNSNIVIAISNM